MTKDSHITPQQDPPTSTATLTVGEYKAMLKAGVPIELVRRAKRLFCVRHFSADALDDKESAEPDALYYSTFMWEFLPCAVVPAATTTFDLPRALNPALGDITFSDLEGNAHPALKAVRLSVARRSLRKTGAQQPGDLHRSGAGMRRSLLQRIRCAQLSHRLYAGGGLVSR